MSQNRNQIHVTARAVIQKDEHILLCKTLDLNPGFYFLPGGHIEHGESAENGLIRELQEETGLSLKIKRFLGCLEYHFEPSHASICHNHEYSLIFEIETSHLNISTKLSSPESHLGLVWMRIDQLANIDFKAEPLAKLIPKWLNSNIENYHSEMI